MEAPAQINATRLGDYLEVMTKAVFQSGMNWKVVEAKWPGIRAAFKDFDPEAVATLTPADLDRIATDPAVIRNRRKIEATVENAATMLALAEQHGGFREYLRSQGGFDATASDLKKRFHFVGDLAAYYLLYVVGEQVPPHEEWMATRGVAMERRRRPSTSSLPRRER